jgi:hypothetical protein
MHTIVGIFRTRVAADQALNGLLKNGIPQQSIIFLTGDRPQAEIASVPTTDAEPDGMGKTLGSYVGGIVGAGAGLYLGSVLASLVVPGVGPILAAGIGAAAALGLGGAAAGGTVGNATEHAMDEGVPKDDIILYRELLKRDRSLVIVNVGLEELAAAARSVMLQNGTEDIETFRKNLQDAA